MRSFHNNPSQSNIRVIRTMAIKIINRRDDTIEFFFGNKSFQFSLQTGITWYTRARALGPADKANATATDDL